MPTIQRIYGFCFVFSIIYIFYNITYISHLLKQKQTLSEFKLLNQLHKPYEYIFFNFQINHFNNHHLNYI